jgi:hypothetical protein
MIVLPQADEQQDHSQHGAEAASRFPPNERYAADERVSAETLPLAFTE